MNAQTTSPPTDPAFTMSYWPEDRSQPIPDMTAGQLLRDAAAEVPDLLALVEAVPKGAPSLSGAATTDRTWTYAELLADAERCAHWLLTKFSPGEHIVVWAPNIPEWVIVEYGCALAGLVLVTANPSLRSAELAYVLRQSHARGLFYAAAFRGTDMAAIVTEISGDLPLVREKFCFADWPTIIPEGFEPSGDLPHVAPSDALQIQYTSGTTGAPKGARLHHRGLVANARLVVDRYTFPQRGVWVSAMPLFHTSGSAMSVLGSATARATYVLCQYFDPELVMQHIADRRGDALVGVPTMLIGIAEHPRRDEFDLSSVQVMMSGGASVPPDLVRLFEAKLDAPFTIVYGETEASPVITQTRPADSEEDRALTVGQPLPHVEVKVVDPTTGAIVPIGEQGEICARGYQVMLGYYDMPEATAAAIDAEGWLHTGDLGTMDRRGYFAITGRLKDMIIRGGENVYPREIEEVLFAHPQIADVAVVGVKDAKWGEQIAAVIRIADLADPPSAAALHDFCRKHLAPHKTPIYWYHTTDFPLTGSGKVQKFRLVALLAENVYPVLT